MADAPLITSEDFDALEPKWLALWNESLDATPFHHPAWHRVWLRHFGENTAPVFLAIRRAEALIGVAALDMDREEARELGDHNVRDYAGPLAASGEESAVAAGILEWLREDLTPRVTFWGLASDTSVAVALQDPPPGSGWAPATSPEAVCPGTDLPDDFETFVGALPKHDRHELRRKMRNLEAAGKVTFESLTEPEPVSAAMDALFDLMRRSRADKAEFLTPTMEAFFRDLAATFAGLGLLRLSKLSLDGTTAGMTLSFDDGRTLYLYNSGFEPEHSKLAVGLLSKAYAIREAISLGRRRFDFLRGEEDYKRRLGGIDRQVVTVTLRDGG
ncbi:MAG: GNAT family N-acetyltransferase [Dehalococcoidia bacterium]